MKVVGEATRALPDLARDLRSGGFGHGGRGLARDLYLSFTATVVASRGTEAESMAWALGRALALDLNRIGAREESLMVVKGLIDFVGIAHADKTMLAKLRRDEETIRRELGRQPSKPSEPVADRPPDKNFSWKAKVFKTSRPQEEVARPPAAYTQSRSSLRGGSPATARSPARPTEPGRREPSLEEARQASEPRRVEPGSAIDPIAAAMSKAARPAESREKTSDATAPAASEHAQPSNISRPDSPKPAPESEQLSWAADSDGAEPREVAEEPARPSPEAAEAAIDEEKWAASDSRTGSGEEIEPALDGPGEDGPEVEETIDDDPEDQADPQRIELAWDGISDSGAQAGDWASPGAQGAGLRGDVGRLSVDREDRALPPLIGEFRPPRRVSRRGTAFFLGMTTTIVAALAYGYATHNWKLISSYVPGITTAFAPAAPSAAKPTAPAPPKPPPAPPLNTASNSAEKLPAPGEGRVLSMEEVRYCIFQGRRLSELRNQMTGLGGNDLVGRYNDLVSDFNGRCRSFRYEKGVLEAVQREAVEKEGQLKADASAILAAWRPAGVQPQPVKATEPQVREEPLIDLAATWGAARVQMRLMDLGFYRGTIDGVWGPQSKKALKTFKQNNGLGVDDNWDIGTQSALLGRES